MRPHTTLGLLRRVALIRWQRLSQPVRFVLVMGTAALAAGALVRAAGGCPLLAASCPHTAPSLADADNPGCPHAAAARTD